MKKLFYAFLGVLCVVAVIMVLHTVNNLPDSASAGASAPQPQAQAKQPQILPTASFNWDGKAITASGIGDASFDWIIGMTDGTYKTVVQLSTDPTGRTNTNYFHAKLIPVGDTQNCLEQALIFEDVVGRNEVSSVQRFQIFGGVSSCRMVMQVSLTRPLAWRLVTTALK